MDFYTVLIFVTLIGFGLLAFVLLWPVHQFLDREQEASKQWTQEALAQRLREQQTTRQDAQDAEDEKDAKDVKPEQPEAAPDPAPPINEASSSSG